VVTAAPNSFCSYQNVQAARLYRLPDHMSFETGATTSSVYNTAHHALRNLARVRKGEGRRRLGS
jgi:NADPH:quinone reductase-like Zn-dependent oxidoreductase